MQLTPLDWAIVVASILVSFAPAVWLARRAGSSTAEFFTSGRAAPWWLVGVSMVATTFSTDTPNFSLTNFDQSFVVIRQAPRDGFSMRIPTAMIGRLG